MKNISHLNFKKTAAQDVIRYSPTNLTKKIAKQYIYSTMLMFTKCHFYTRLMRNQLHLPQNHLHCLLHY